MKTTSNLKTLALCALTITGLNLFASCDSCDRKDDIDTTTGPAYDEGFITESDTVDNDHAGRTTEDAGAGSSVRNSGTGGASNSSNTASGSSQGTSSNTGTTNSESTGYGDSNSPIENSSSTSVKNGKPVKNSGTSGSGMGTGTGSTGNNSKVSSPADQRNR